MPRSSKTARADYQRDWSLNRNYGISSDDYDTMLALQGGVCAICKTPPSSAKAKPSRSGNRLVVDHNHKTGRIRGLIHRRCNLGLGHFDDDAVTLARALEYLLKDDNGNSSS